MLSRSRGSVSMEIKRPASAYKSAKTGRLEFPIGATPKRGLITSRIGARCVYGTFPLSTGRKKVVASSTSTGTETTGGTNFFFTGLAASSFSSEVSTDSFVSSVLSTREILLIRSSQRGDALLDHDQP